MSSNEVEITKKLESDRSILAALKRISDENEIRSVEEEARILYERLAAAHKRALIIRMSEMHGRNQMKINKFPEQHKVNDANKISVENKKQADEVINILLVQEIGGTNNGCKCVLL